MSENMEIKELPRCLPEISSWLLWKKNGEKVYSVGNVDIDKYIMVPENKLEIIMYAISLMDGEHTISSIDDAVYDKFEKHLDVESVIEKLNKANLTEQRTESIDEITTFSKKIISYRFKKFSQVKSNIIKTLYAIWLVLSVIFVGLAITNALMYPDKSDEFFSKSMKFKDSYLLGALITVLASIINIFFHELSHASASVLFNLQPSEFTMNLYGGFKFIWMVRIKGMYTIDRLKRVFIMFAGIMTNISIGCLCFFVCVRFELGNLSVELLSKVMINNVFMILACSMPFNLSDGYYIITQLSKRQNMRKRMFGIIGLSKAALSKADFWDMVYTLISFSSIIFGFYLSGRWAYGISIDIYENMYVRFGSTVLSVIVCCIPLIFIIWLNSLFIIRLVKLVKNSR